MIICLIGSSILCKKINFTETLRVDNGLSGDLEVSEGDEDENDDDDENCKQKVTKKGISILTLLLLI